MIRLGGMVKSLGEAFSRNQFITDFGEPLAGTNMTTGEKISIPRYGVWGDKGHGKPEVIETSDDLQYLLRKYHLDEKAVVPLSKIKNKS